MKTRSERSTAASCEHITREQVPAPRSSRSKRRVSDYDRFSHERNAVLITGGAGFIGTNLADRLLSDGRRVIIYDNLSRRGSESNLSWLFAKHGPRLGFEQGDTRNFGALRAVVKQASTVFHFAAQVAVTDSLVNPRFDFDVNAGGTLHLLEAIRELANPPALLFTSTNKVYGALADLELYTKDRRYWPSGKGASPHGISETRCLDFHSPYGCSKGAADQYILDYARTFHLPALVFRMSCIYGPHQNGTEDQGWVAHFLIRANERGAISVYGDGMQVRDLLFVDDLVDAFGLAMRSIECTAGQAFNIGGGPQNSASLLELLALIEEVRNEPCRVLFGEWRHADQRYYVSDTRKFHSQTGWAPRVSVREGIPLLQAWLAQRQGFEAPASGDLSRGHEPITTGARNHFSLELSEGN